ncbi:MAG: dienelactone hydrolase family protein [Bacteroidetes bacterium]|nr:dienelactone hydrolase family protein [Bacteroidota bacterium]
MLLLSSCGSGSQSESSNETASEQPKGLVEQEIDYQLDSLNMKGYLVYDERFEGKRPAVLVVHEWWGHNDYPRSRARMLAELGYVALSIDMYGDGKTADHPEDAQAFMMESLSDMGLAKARFIAALDLVKQNEMTDPTKTGAIGYCFGGAVVLHMARFGVDLDGVVSFHGNLGTEYPAESGKVMSRVLVCNGADDPFVPEDQHLAFKTEMESAGIDYEFIDYPGSVHAFTNPAADASGKKFNLPLAYNEAADKQSWEKMKVFFNEIFADQPN